MASGGDDPLDYAPPPSAKRSSPTWCGVLTLGALVMSGMALVMGSGARRGGLYPDEVRNAAGLVVLSVVCIVGAAIRLTASPRAPRRPIVVTLYLVGLALALAMVATATWGLVTGMYL